MCWWAFQDCWRSKTVEESHGSGSLASHLSPAAQTYLSPPAGTLNASEGSFACGAAVGDHLAVFGELCQVRRCDRFCRFCVHLCWIQWRAVGLPIQVQVRFVLPVSSKVLNPSPNLSNALRCTTITFHPASPNCALICITVMD